MLNRFGRFRGAWMCTLAATTLFAPPLTLAQDKNAAPSPAVAIDEKPGEAGPGGPGKKDDKPKRFPDFSEVTKDMKATEGLFTIYRNDAGDRDKDQEKILCRIPRSLLNEDLLFATTINAGGALTGFQWADALVRWEIVDRNLKMVTPDLRYITKDDKPVSDVIRRTYNERFMASVPIVTMTPSGDPVIDLGQLLKSDLADVSMGGGSIRPELSKWSKVKVFPENVLIGVDLAVTSRGSSGGSTIEVGYSFQRLPKLGAYKSREADPRVGYFLTQRVDWAKPVEARETMERYINRWHLEKRDPSLEVSPPKKPITFIIEKTVPIMWRRYVKEGIEEWNKAFEKIGFVDAVVAQQQTDDNEFADYDPEDSRYNFFRWIVSGRGFAMGPSRADPRTGQILDADIIMDDAFMRAWTNSQFNIYTPSAYARTKGPGFELYMQRYPDLIPEIFKRQPLETTTEFHRETERLLAEAEKRLSHNGCNPFECSYAEGMTHQVALLQQMFIATGSGKKVPERLLGEALREVVAHEVGHTLGLRHNFKASSWLTADEIQRRRNETDEPTVASVMDYNPLLFYADDDLTKLRHVVTPCIGPYDYFVIEYGYKIPGKDDKGEEDMLRSIAARGTEPGLAYGTDEDTMGIFSPDPYTNRYDNTSDQVAWARQRVAIADKLLNGVCDWSLKDGEPRYYITQAFNILSFEKARNFDYVARLIGGQSFNRDHKGDPNCRPTFVQTDAETQRAALKFINENLFSDAFFKFDAATLNNLAPSRWYGLETGPPIRLDYDIHDKIAMMQVGTLMDLLSPPLLQRLYDGELKTTEPKKFTAAELITGVRDQIWSSLDKSDKGSYSDSQPMCSSLTRNLQREHLNMMLALAQSPPGAAMSADLNGMIRYALRELSERIDASLKKGKPDFATRAHMVESKSRIDRVLDAQFTAR
ncbi:MAG: zinc-dependent metalloprotease [Phycisphaerales bacterium]|nr:zinc-dependent metalloprotease [Phycisphaerales bacterium]